MANSKNESMEVWETRYPVEFVSYSLVPDSGGAGKYRGGLGTEKRFRVLCETRISGISDHHLSGARGVGGGHEGLPNGFAVERSSSRIPLQEMFGLPSPSKFWNLPLEPGDVFVSIQGGGGGYGHPLERSSAALEIDVREGYVTEEEAFRLYGMTSIR
jgi:N-methylhydantoinase B/oxoprolinase/acetone carboxylase alpha subunit